jgi:hypothetical protein
MRINSWKNCIRNRPKWNEVVEKAKTFEVVAPQEEKEDLLQTEVNVSACVVYTIMQ